jgi:quinol monooxygenase YgiN
MNVIMVTGQARFAPGEIERLRGLLNAWIEEARSRAGCLSYHYAVDLGDPDLVHVVEMWRDEAAIDTHMTDMGGLMAALGGARLLSLDVKAYRADYLKTLMGD